MVHLQTQSFSLCVVIFNYKSNIEMKSRMKKEIAYKLT